MNGNEDFMNKEPLKQMLSGLGKQMHMSSEMILAYARGILSQEGRSEVASHIEGCNECADLFDVAKKLLKAEKEADSERSESGSKIQLRPTTKSKIELIAMLNAKRPQLVDVMLNSFVPPAPEAIITDQQQFLSPSIVGSTLADQIEGQHRRDDVREIVNFILLVQYLIVEQCNDLKQMRQELPRCIDEAMVILHIAKHDEQARSKVTKMLSEVFFEENE